MSNILPKISTFGGFVGWVVGMLAFFGVDAKMVGQQMTSHYLFLVTSLSCFTICVAGIYYWWKSTRITPGNVQARVREWLDAFSFEHGIAPEWHAWHFGYRVRLPGGPSLSIARVKSRGDSLLFLGQITAVNPYDRAAYDALTNGERDKLFYQLRLETSRANFFFNSDATLDQVTFERWVPITSKLTAASFIEIINQMYFSANIIWSTISLRVGGTPALALPSTPPGKKGPTITSEDEEKHIFSDDP